MSIRRVDGWWTAFADITTLSGERLRSQRKARKNTMTSAREMLEELTEDLLCDKPSAVSFSELADSYMTLWCEINNRPSTVNRNKSVLKIHLMPFFGGVKDISTITGLDIERLKAKNLKAGLSPKTVNMNLGVLRKMMNCALEWGMVDKIPKIKDLRVAPQQYEFLDFEEAERLVDAAWGQWKVMVIMALHTGMRRGELRALRWTDLDLPGQKIFVRRAAWHDHIDAPKNNRTREIPMTDTLCSALKSHRHLMELVFPDENGELIHTVAMTKAIKRIAQKAGLARLGGSWHCLRHTFASHLAMRGAPLRTIQELGGWADLSMVLRYSHLTPDHRRDIIGLLDSKNRDSLATGAIK